MLRSNLDTSQPIFALCSGTSPTAIAVIRISGHNIFNLLTPAIRPLSGELLAHKRSMFQAELIHPISGKKVDSVLVLSFVSPHSFTGEDTIELQCHGSTAVVNSCTGLLLDVGIRPAAPGEFSYRAVLNGKMTPTEIEILGDLFKAQTQVDLDRIYSRRDPLLEQQVARLRKELLDLQAVLDTAVDFSDEYSSVIASAHEYLRRALNDCSVLSQSYDRFKQGLTIQRIVLAGYTNAGKSSLFNAILGRSRALVSDEAGTTRDVVEEDLFLAGTRWRLVDTAGVRTTKQRIERLGIELGSDYLAASSYWLLVVDGTIGLRNEEETLLARFSDIPHLILWNKADLSDWKPPHETVRSRVLPISARAGLGVRELMAFLEDFATNRLQSSVPLPTSVQAARLKQVGRMLEELGNCVANGEPPEFLAERNRDVLNSLESVLGEIGVEDVLDRLFSEFCIGK